MTTETPTTETTEPNGVECLQCSTVTHRPGTEGEPFVPSEDFDPCDGCGDSEFTQAVVITACPAADPGECAADEHHFGLGLHVAEVAR